MEKDGHRVIKTEKSGKQSPSEVGNTFVGGPLSINLKNQPYRNNYTPVLEANKKRIQELEQELSDARNIFSKCSEYLCAPTYEKGKPTYLNSIGGYSVLHKKMIDFLEKQRESK